MALTVPDAIAQIFSLWGIEDPNASNTDARTRALSDLNRSIQMVWQNPEKLEYFCRSTLTQTISANTSPLALSGGIQNLLGPVRRSGDSVPLNPIGERSEFENFARYYFGQDALAGGPPIAYYLERSTQSGPDALVLKLFPVPVPLINTDILLDVVMNCPAYTWADYTAVTPIPMPHAYAESILIPILRKAAMSFHYFVLPARAPLIEAEYTLAREMLGLAEPEVEELKPEFKPIAALPWNQRRDK